MTVPAIVTVLAVLAAAAVGAVVGYRYGRRDTAATRRPTGPTVAELLARLVRRSHTGIVVVNRHGDVVLSNDRAEALGAVVDSRPDPRVLVAVERAVADGDVQDAAAGQASDEIEVDLSPLTLPPGRAPQSIIAQVRALGDGFVAVDITDTSAATRLEAVRRDFVANVGHELKTPVGAMTVLAEAVLDADDADEVEHFATKILHESRRLGALVVELIELSRLQGADRLPEPTRVDVDDVLSDALARVHGSGAATSTSDGAAEARDRVHVDEDSGLAVAGDRTLLVTALTNLLENALAYSPDGSPVSVRRRAVEGRVEISVTDRGIGIAPEHQLRVFERFFRVDRARSRATGGTGLGLAIVKHVAANHGGEVRLWSEPGVGSTFTMRIPAAGTAGSPSTPPHGAATAPPTSTVSGGPPAGRPLPETTRSLVPAPGRTGGDP